MTLNYPAGPRYDTKLSSRGSSVQGPSGHKGDGVCEGRSDGASQNPASSKGTGGRKITQVEFISRWQTGKGEGLQCGMAWSFALGDLWKHGSCREWIASNKGLRLCISGWTVVKWIYSMECKEE
jgi:hypothetical protein